MANIMNNNMVCNVLHRKNGTQLSAPRVKGYKTKWNFIATLKQLSTISNEDRQQGASNPMA
jgi:hypothetical protein